MQHEIEIIDEGVIGQIQGPFNSNTNFSFENKLVKLGIFISEKDLMTFNWEFPIEITMEASPQDITERIIVYKPGIYEPNVALPIKILSFPDGAPTGVFVDYVILEPEE